MFARNSATKQPEVLEKLADLSNLISWYPPSEMERSRLRLQINSEITKLRKIDACKSYELSMILSSIIGNLKDVKQYYAKASRLGTNSILLYNYALSLNVLGSISEAIAVLQDNLMTYQGDPEIYVLLAELLSDAGYFRQAADVLQSGSKLNNETITVSCLKLKRIVDFYEENQIEESETVQFFSICYQFMHEKGLIFCPREEGIVSDGLSSWFTTVLTVNLPIDFVMDLNEELISRLVDADLSDKVNTLFTARIR